MPYTAVERTPPLFKIFRFFGVLRTPQTLSSFEKDYWQPWRRTSTYHGSVSPLTDSASRGHVALKFPRQFLATDAFLLNVFYSRDTLF